MESVFVLSAAAQQRVRAVAIRAISDDVESKICRSISIGAFNERGAVSIPRVLGQIVTRPHRIGGLIRLAHESERAAESLAGFLDAYVQRVTLGPLPEIAKAEALAL